MRRLRSLLAVVFPPRFPACPVCHKVIYIKSMPLHISGHKPMDRDVIAYRERQGAAPDNESPLATMPVARPEDHLVRVLVIAFLVTCLIAAAIEIGNYTLGWN